MPSDLGGCAHSLPYGLSQSFDGRRLTHFLTMVKTIGNGFRDTEDPYAVDALSDYVVGKEPAGKPNESDGLKTPRQKDHGNDKSPRLV